MVYLIVFSTVINGSSAVLSFANSHTKMDLVQEQIALLITRVFVNFVDDEGLILLY